MDIIITTDVNDDELEDDPAFETPTKKEQTEVPEVSLKTLKKANDAYNKAKGNKLKATKKTTSHMVLMVNRKKLLHQFLEYRSKCAYI